MNVKILMVISISFFFLFSCQNVEDKIGNNDIPKIIGFKSRAEYDSICNAIDKEAENKIKSGIIEIVFKDTFKYNNDFVIFDSVLQNRTGLKLNNKYQLDFENCYKEKMDSLIISKYGRNYKDSVIKLVYQITDSIIKSRNQTYK